jgi:hypothetical protein
MPGCPAVPCERNREKTVARFEGCGDLRSSYAEANGLGVQRVRQHVSAMAFLVALERVREEDSPRRFLIKGGIACELRFQDSDRPFASVSFQATLRAGTGADRCFSPLPG